MNKNNVDRKFREYAKLTMEKARLEEEIDNLKSEITKYMVSRDVKELSSDEHKAIYQEISQNKIDTKRLKEEKPRIAKMYTVQSSYMRFTFK